MWNERRGVGKEGRGWRINIYTIYQSPGRPHKSECDPVNMPLYNNVGSTGQSDSVSYVTGRISEKYQVFNRWISVVDGNVYELTKSYRQNLLKID